MLPKFEAFVKKNRLFNKKSRLLLALSGGEDSMCLLHLLLDGGYNFSVAHCNFGLRDSESDADENFVRKTAKKNKIEAHFIRFETKAEAKKLGMNTQEAARTLRYNWFESLKKTHGYDRVLTAHHMDDNTETMLINLLRGTGISGLHGIRLSNKAICRPLLFAQKTEISDYMAANGYKFRLDSSNIKDDYTRNQLRHHVIPMLRKIDRQVDVSFNHTASNLKEFEDLSRQLILEKWNALVNILDNNDEFLAFEKLEAIESGIKDALLYECLKNKGFSRDQTDKLSRSNKARTGFHLLSSSHEIIKERKGLLIRPLQEKTDVRIVLDVLPSTFTIGPNQYKVELMNSNGIDYKQKGVLFLDFNSIALPISIRPWQAGDKMVPLGMKGRKKISDILTDKKVPNAQRKSVHILLNANGELLAILPDMPSDVHKVRHKSKQVLRLMRI